MLTAVYRRSLKTAKSWEDKIGGIMDGFYNNWPNDDRVLVNYVVSLDTSSTYAKILDSIGICF